MGPHFQRNFRSASFSKQGSPEAKLMGMPPPGGAFWPVWTIVGKNPILQGRSPISPQAEFNNSRSTIAYSGKQRENLAILRRLERLRRWLLIQI